MGLATTSVPPPGAYGTTQRMGFVGKALCANAPDALSSNDKVMECV